MQVPDHYREFQVCTSVAFAHDRSFIVAAYDGDKIRLWRPWETDLSLYEETIHNSSGSITINSISCSPDNKHFACGGDYGIRLYRRRVPVESPAGTKQWGALKGLKFKEHSKEWVTAVAFSHCGSKLVSGSSTDNTVRLWNVKAGTQLNQFRGHHLPVTSVRFSADDKQVISASNDKTICIWDARTAKQSKIFVGHSDTVSSIALAEGGTQILSASHDRTLRIWDALAESNDAAPDIRARITLLATSPDGTRLAAATEKFSVQIYDASTGLQLVSMKKHTGAITSLDMSRNNQLVASASTDTTVCIWNMSSGSCHNVISSQAGAVHSVKFLTDNVSVVLGTVDKSVQVWNAQAGNRLNLLQGHADEVLDVAVSPDGEFIASASKDTTIYIWRSSQLTQFQKLDGHEEIVCTVTFSASSEFLASASRDCTCLWNLKDNSLTQRFNYGCFQSTTRIRPGCFQLNRIRFSTDQQYITLGFVCLPTGLPPTTQQPAANYSNDAKYYMKDGWIFHVDTQWRVCWVPQSHRGALMVGCRNGVALTTSFGDQVVVLDFTALAIWGDISQ